ncbi:HesA/MoeB/ThiF family protein [Dinoroseobacter sp. PD6]|uniref:HesA/MoeB/ThiF family protein n=1 Tax=Dinoroseobacter sp. PD6 TaxID=3028384 RepID=UPI00237B4F9D|nr:HesA/MoeB/ThiF family protein [Dinoroseobacter sp. PD6]MDD9716850.1 HesA/MoeB/ThiF family protein [Dinoroseobacter sp. PD6]
MFFVFFLALTIWLVARRAGLPSQARWLLLGLLYVAVLGIQVLLPEGTPLRVMTGGSPALWLILGGFAVLVVLYRAGLRRVRARVQAPPPSETRQTGPFSDVELDRYARHIVMREIGGLGQKRLKEAKVLVVGAGGLGSPVLLYLAGAGVGTIGVIDHDTVSLSNLQRQVIHTDARSGMPKVFSAEMAMTALNPHITVRPYNRRLTAEIAEELFAEYDLILDGNDNFETRTLVNKAAVATGKPLISGAIAQWEGQISLFDPVRGAPCYACIFPKAPADGLAPSCAEAGVAGPLPGVIGTMMALEAMKELTDAGTGLSGRMMLYDALNAETRTVKLKRRADCPVCGHI